MINKMHHTDELILHLLKWYDTFGRELPWRQKPKHHRNKKAAIQQVLGNPYFIWLSEIMLQQTTVKTVIPYYNIFVKKWPTISLLAKASLEDILVNWAGLGYYARARNLHKCSRIISMDLNGNFPSSEAELNKLPGIGPYTAAAISAIAFGLPTMAVDVNIERVMARMYAVSQPLPKSKKKLSDLASGFISNERPGDVLQALMDLGATICKPQKPLCDLCPWAWSCRGLVIGSPANLPLKTPKLPIKQRFGYAFWIVRKDGAILLRRRPDNGMLGGMIEVTSSDWLENESMNIETMSYKPCLAEWKKLPGSVIHTFSHFRLNLTVYAAQIDGRKLRGGSWYMREQFNKLALPKLTQKIIEHVDSASQKVS
tara:strand:- start:8042 stop:9151 length:1110 start_codon:yes stop_codon:yes gene_type:complete